MITIDGQARIVPAALLEIDTPYYRGSLDALVLSSLIRDLVLRKKLVEFLILQISNG